MSEAPGHASSGAAEGAKSEPMASLPDRGRLSEHPLPLLLFGLYKARFSGRLELETALALLESALHQVRDRGVDAGGDLDGVGNPVRTGHQPEVEGVAVADRADLEADPLSQAPVWVQGDDAHALEVDGSGGAHLVVEDQVGPCERAARRTLAAGATRLRLHDAQLVDRVRGR